MNLFEALEGRRSEDLVTQALLLILESPAFRDLQRLFYARVLEDSRLSCTEERQFRIASQEADKQHGRPDLRIEGDDTLILVENKFTASFTLNQLRRYVKILQEAGKANSILVLVCPRHLRPRYEQEIPSQFQDLGGPFNCIDALQRSLRSTGIHLLIVDWEELLRILDSEHLVVAELATFIAQRFLVKVEFTEKEVKRIMSAEIPELLKKTFALVDRIKGEAGGRGIDVGRSSQSYAYYGFHLSRNGWRFYFGYFLNSWITHRTPFFLQTRLEWQRDVETTEDQIQQAGFVKDANEGFLLPLRIEPGEEVALRIIVDQLEQSLSQLAGPQTTASEQVTVR